MINIINVRWEICKQFAKIYDNKIQNKYFYQKNIIQNKYKHYTRLKTTTTEPKRHFQSELHPLCNSPPKIPLSLRFLIFPSNNSFSVSGKFYKSMLYHCLKIGNFLFFSISRKIHQSWNLQFHLNHCDFLFAVGSRFQIWKNGIRRLRLGLNATTLIWVLKTVFKAIGVLNFD